MSKETLRRAAENDPTLTTLNIARRRHFVIFDEREEDRDAKGGVFDPNIKSDLGKLGGSIANNTTLEKVVIDGEDFPHSTATRSNRKFFDGFKHNTSINTLVLTSFEVSHGVGYEILQSFQDRCHPLRLLTMLDCDLGNRVEDGFDLSSFGCIKELSFIECNVGDQCLQTILAPAISGFRDLKMLELQCNSIGRSGCEILANFLKDPNTNLLQLNLDDNNLGDSC